MDVTPQDFVNLVSSYLPWPERRMICDNSNLFDKAYSDKLLLSDITSLSSREIKLEALISRLYSTYTLIEEMVHFDGGSSDIDISIIPEPTPEQIIAIIDRKIEPVLKEKLRLDLSTGFYQPNKFVIMFRIHADVETHQINISIASNMRTIKRIGTHLLCHLNLNTNNVGIDTCEIEELKYELEKCGNEEV